MKQTEIKEMLIKKIKRYAYEAAMHEELKNLKYDVHMQEYEMNICRGKAFAAMEILSVITEKACDDIYEAAEDEARNDIKTAGCDMVKLLNLAGYDGPTHFNYGKEEWERNKNIA